jgi:hypothetical protein
MAQLRVIDENGNEQLVRVADSNTSLVVEETGDTQTEFVPAVVQRVEFDGDPNMSSITTVCGEQENRQESETKADIVIEGVVVQSQLPDIKNLEEGQRITLLSDVHDSEVIIKRISIEQSADLVEYVPDGGQSELAFNFQLQLKEP